MTRLGHFSLGSLLNHFAEQQAAQIPANVQQQILQIASVPTAHQTPVVSTPVPIQPKPAPKPIAPSTINPSIVQHKQSFHSKVTSIEERTKLMKCRAGQCECLSQSKCGRIGSTGQCATAQTKAQ